MSKILELREKRAKAWDAAKQFLDAKRGADGMLSEEDTAAYDKMEQDVMNLGKVVLVYKCRQKKLNNLYYKKKEQRRCSTWRKIKNRILRNSSSRSSISIMLEVPPILNWNVNMA